MTGDEYLNLDLSKEGKIAADLFGKIAGEAMHEEDIVLTGDGDPGSWSENLTPEMNSWMAFNVVPARQKMLGEIEQQARKFRLGDRGGDITGIVYSIEQDRLERKLNWDISKLYTDFKQQYGSDLSSKRQLRSEYSKMKAEIGRDAINRSFFIKSAPPALAGIIEGIFNYSNLIEVLPSGLISLGVTLVIVLVVAFGVHFLGKGLAERGYWMEAGRQERQKNIMITAGGFIALFIILAIVFAIRYIGLQEDVQRAELIGKDAPNIFLIVIQLVGFNLAIYLIGVLTTAKQYDPNPEFAELAEKLNEAEERLAKLKKKNVYDPREKLIEKRDLDNRRIKDKARQMDGMDGFAELLGELNKLEEQDNRVIGLLTEYRNRLRQAIRPKSGDLRFKKNTAQSFPDDDSEDLSLAEFAAARLYLYKAEA
ncbi:hypothetical protein [Sphingomonas hengshuiensis]|uniref:Uncharacterized protein n=1 Tax=Sphingomonas hengshuiensis TaxID=1609977 RepID=A0A7U4J6V4_9SPHN|nr:hypothetical protein [Sphingomonas hengshuiensis]AJP71333.1 hypothetical protein TS85_05365 [Sphingomonas hengshuiensis]